MVFSFIRYLGIFFLYLSFSVSQAYAEDSEIIYNAPATESSSKRTIADAATSSANRGFSRGFSRGSGQRNLSRKNRDFLKQVAQEPSENIVSLPNQLVAIGPDHTGLTNSASPKLYWYISQAWKNGVHISLNKPRSAKPLLQLTINNVDKSGIYELDLKKHGVTLKPNVEYEWFMYLIIDNAERSSDMFASSSIKYQTSDTLKHGKSYDAITYAKNGYWYDAFAVANSNQQKQTLLRQVGLEKVASSLN